MAGTQLAIEKHRRRGAGMSGDQIVAAKRLGIDLSKVPPGDQRADKIKRAVLKDLRDNRAVKSNGLLEAVNTLFGTGDPFPSDQRQTPVEHDGTKRYFLETDAQNIRELQDWIDLLKPENQSALGQIIEKPLAPNERPSRQQLWSELMSLAVGDPGIRKGSLHCERSGGFRSAIMAFVLFCSEGVVHATLNTESAFKRFWKKRGRMDALSDIERIEQYEERFHWYEELRSWGRLPKGFISPMQELFQETSLRGLQDNSLAAHFRADSTRSTFDLFDSPIRNEIDRLRSGIMPSQAFPSGNSIFSPSPMEELRSRIQVFEKSPFQKTVESSLAFGPKPKGIGVSMN